MFTLNIGGSQVLDLLTCYCFVVRPTLLLFIQVDEFVVSSFYFLISVISFHFQSFVFYIDYSYSD